MEVFVFICLVIGGIFLILSQLGEPVPKKSKQIKQIQKVANRERKNSSPKSTDIEPEAKPTMSFDACIEPEAKPTISFDQWEKIEFAKAIEIDPVTRESQTTGEIWKKIATEKLDGYTLVDGKNPSDIDY